MSSPFDQVQLSSIGYWPTPVLRSCDSLDAAYITDKRLGEILQACQCLKTFTFVTPDLDYVDAGSGGICSIL